MDKHFKVETIANTHITPQVLSSLGILEDNSSQLLSWLAAHRDYSEELSIVDNPPFYLPKTDKSAGEKLIGMILSKGHFGVLEHAHITLECSGFPHSVPVQARTHRVATSFDVQSQRYTGKRIIKLVEFVEEMSSASIHYIFDRAGTKKDLSREEVKEVDIFWSTLEDIFYSRPSGTYRDRNGKLFEILENDRKTDLLSDYATAERYYHRVMQGYSEECARDRLAQSIRQSFFITTNIRGFMHFLDMRSKADAQIEIQWLTDLMFDCFQKWVCQIAEWYEKKRLHKNKLAP